MGDGSRRCPATAWPLSVHHLLGDHVSEPYSASLETVRRGLTHPLERALQDARVEALGEARVPVPGAAATSWRGHPASRAVIHVVLEFAASVETFTHRAQILALRHHETFEARDRLPEIFVFVFRVHGRVEHLLQSLARAGVCLARLDERHGGFFHRFEHGTEGIGHGGSIRNVVVSAHDDR